MTNLPGGHVYFLEMEKPGDPDHDFELVKIGITGGDVPRRVSTLQTGNPYKLVCRASFKTPWPREVEYFMHQTHAHKMFQNEWLRWRRDGLQTLVDEAKAEARRIEARKEKELACIALNSNGQERQATPEVVRLHREATELMKKLVPERRTLDAAANWLKASTGATMGIPGIVRVKYVSPNIRFDAKLAESQLRCLESNSPRLAAECRVERSGEGRFCWRGISTRSCFTEEHQGAAEAAAKSVDEVLRGNVRLQGWTDRTPDLERWHDDFLRATQAVHKHGAEIDALKTELTVQLGEYDAFIGVCSYLRRSVTKIHRPSFCRNFPEESKRCAEHVAAQLRKHVYRTRSYLVDSERY